MERNVGESKIVINIRIDVINIPFSQQIHVFINQINTFCRAFIASSQTHSLITHFTY